MRPKPRPWFPIALIALAATPNGPTIAQAQGPESDAPTIQGARIGYGESDRGRYKVGTWTPVWIEVQGGRSAFQGQVELTAPDDDGTSTTIRFPANLPATKKSTIPAIVRPGTRLAEVAIRLLDAESRPIDSDRPKTFAPEPIEPATQLVLGAGRPSGLADVLDLPRFRNAPSTMPSLVIAPLNAWPSVWYGFDGAGAIVLDSGDRATLEQLRAGSLEVLRKWVAQGGHLVVTLGENWKAAHDLLGDLLPAEPTAAIDLTDVSSIESFAGNPPHPLEAPIRAIRLAGWSERGATLLATAATTPLVVRGSYGLGRVTLVGFNVADPPFADWDDKRLFWDRALDLRGRTVESGADLALNRGAIIQAAAPELAAVLHRSLETFPGVRIIPFGWVALAVFAYIVLIGPLDYLFLRRVVKRMEWTWITFPLIVVAVTVLGYLGAHALKGETLRVNKVDLLDLDQISGQLRGMTWMTVFSPSNHDYGLAIQPSGPDLKPAGEATELATTTLSWFAPPVPVLGGTGRVAFGSAGYRYEPIEEPRALAGVRIPIWSTKSFTGRWTGTSDFQAIEASLEPISGDRLIGSVRNLLDLPLRNVQLFHGRNLYNLGTLRPRGVARVDPTRTEAMSSALGRLIQSLERRRVSSDPGLDRAEVHPIVEARADILRSALFHGATGSRGATHPNLVLRTLDMTAQVAELRRPILVAEVDAPAAQLELKDAPSTPEISQTTLIRILLPLSEPTESSRAAQSRESRVGTPEVSVR